MNKYLKTTLGKKILAFYLVLFLIGFYFMQFPGYDFIYKQVYNECTNELVESQQSLISSTISSRRFSDENLNAIKSNLSLTSGALNCRIMLISYDGDILIDTSNQNSPLKNIYEITSDTSFIHHNYTENFTMQGYLKEPYLCVCSSTQKNPYMKGYLLFLHSNASISQKADYYFHVILTVFYLMLILLGVSFLTIYFVNFFPLKKIRDTVKHFSIAHDNPPVHIRSHDEYRDLADTLNVIGDELSKFDEYQRKFLSNISHDFRSPLTSISGYLQAFADGVIPPEETEKYMKIILFETERLTKLTDNILDLNSYNKDNVFLNMTDFDIANEVILTMEVLRGTASKKNIKINYTQKNTNDNTIMVNADKEKIRQVIHNLLDNAIKFSPKNSEINVDVNIRRGKILVSIKDNGIGIPKDDLPLIWDRFYKTDLSRGKDKTGTGLGLSICKEIITAHKQNIDVVSTEGVGTQFTFSLKKAD